MKQIYYEAKADNHLYPQVYISVLDFRMPLHFHNNVEFQYIIQDEYETTIDGVAYKATVDDIIFVPSHYIHAGTRNDALKTIFLMTTNATIVNFTDTFKNKTLPILMQDKEFNRTTILPILEYLLTQPSQYKNNTVMRGFFDVLLGNLIAHYGLVESKMHEKAGHLTDIMKYIDMHYKDDLTLDDVAQHFGYSKFYFSKLFKRLTDISFSEYRNRVKLQKCVKLMSTNKDMSITAAALECGFNSLSSFYRAFHDMYGIPPSKYSTLNEIIYW